MLHLSIAPVTSLKRGIGDFGCKKKNTPSPHNSNYALFTLFPFLLWHLQSLVTRIDAWAAYSGQIAQSPLLQHRYHRQTLSRTDCWTQEIAFFICAWNWPWFKVWWQYTLTWDSRHIFKVYARCLHLNLGQEKFENQRRNVNMTP